jgi:hypothetical protein
MGEAKRMEARAVDLQQLEAALATAATTPLVVHHFATWCDPCAEELPLLRVEFDALKPLGVTLVAISWDLFMSRVPPASAIDACRTFLAQHGAAFDQLLVYTGSPEDLFSSQHIAGGTVPCTEVRAVGGRVVATFPQPLFDVEERRRFAGAVRAAANAR